MEKVSIKIEQAVYSSFRNYSNKSWYVFAEYVDNSWSSFIKHKKKLRSINGRKYQFTITIDINKDKDLIRIWDNAGGIAKEDFGNAFKLGEKPKDVGLNEFGMGMKTSSIWLSDLWSIKSSAIGEKETRSIEFDLLDVVENGLDDLNVKTKEKKQDQCFTEIVLSKLSRNAPNNYQISKIKDHLASIYRIPILSGEMKLVINGDPLMFEILPLLKAPYIKTPSGKKKEWRKEVDFKMGKYKVKGYIGILNKMSNTLSGFSLFRQGRVISGTFDEKYKPVQLFGNDAGSYKYKRLYGELHLEGFNVSHNKGSFQELDELDVIMEGLRRELSSPKENYFLQVEYFPPKTREDDKEAAKKIYDTIKKNREASPLKAKFQNAVKDINNVSKNKKDHAKFKKAKSISPAAPEERIEFNGKDYDFNLELISDSSIDSLYSVFEKENKRGPLKITYKINLAHQFFSRHEDVFKKGKYQPVIDLIEALVFAEITSRSTVRFADKIRDNFNNHLKNLV
jgi:hypothetical protein